MRQSNNSFLFYASGRRFCSELRANLELRRRQDIFAQVSGGSGMMTAVACCRLQQRSGWNEHSSPCHVRTSPSTDLGCIMQCAWFWLDHS